METESVATTCSRCKLLEAEVAALKVVVDEQAKTIKDLSTKFDAGKLASKPLISSRSAQLNCQQRPTEAIELNATKKAGREKQ